MAEMIKYFSVRFAVKIFGARYIPCVCYKLDEALEPSVKKLADTGDAKIYVEKVRFINGRPIPAKKKPLRTAAPPPANPAASGGANTGGKKSGRGGKKAGKRDFE